MTLVLDTGPLISLLDTHDPVELAIAQLLKQEPGQVVLPAPVSAEADYMVRKLVGREARRTYFADLAAGRFKVACLEPEDYALVRSYNEQYADLDVGLADLSIVILAHHFKTRRVLTFDQRHFRVLPPIGGGSFQLLPYDA